MGLGLGSQVGVRVRVRVTVSEGHRVRVRVTVGVKVRIRVRVGCRARLPWAIRSWLDRVSDLDPVERDDGGHYRGGVVHVGDVARHPARRAARHLGLRAQLAAAAPIAHAAELADGWLHLRGSGGSEGARLRAGAL